MRSPYKFNHSKKIPASFLEQFKKIDALSSPSDKIQKLSDFIELTDEEREERKTVYLAIRDILKKYYPDCILAIYGPVMNGFGLKNCDLDLMFLPYPTYPVDPDKPRNEPIVPPPSPESILSGRIQRIHLYNLKDWSHIKFLKMVFKKQKQMAKNAFIKPGQNPTLKINLKGKRWNCDIHIHKKIVSFYSELLQFLEKVDRRVKPLVLTLTFWIQSIGFAKRSLYSDYFSDYVITLLVVFYLQNTDPPILPSVEHLMSNAGYSRMSDGTETAFSKDMNLIEKSNTQPLSELLLNFFEFYWNFDFVQNIISINSGKAIPVKDVFEQSKLKGFEISSMNIQDPFVLSCNVCKYDPDTPELEKLKSEAPVVLFKLALLTAKQFLKYTPDKYKFTMLFHYSDYQLIFDAHYWRHMVGNPKHCFIELDYKCVRYLSRNSEFSLQLWYERVAKAVYEVLQNGLLMECDIMNKMNWSTSVAEEIGETSKEEMQDDSSRSDGSLFDLELIQSLNCNVYSPTWAGRKKPKLETPVGIAVAAAAFNTSVIQAEQKVSKEMIQNIPKSSTPLMRFICNCYKHTSPQMNNVIVLLKANASGKDFEKFAEFLTSYIPNTVKKMMSK